MNINEMELRELIESAKGADVEVALIMGPAKKTMKAGDFKNLATECGLAKDALSLVMKRYRLLEIGFSKMYVQDFTAREIKKLTHKNTEKIEEIRIAREKFLKGEYTYDDFCDVFEKYKIEKSNEDKLISKTKGLVKFISENECSEESKTESAEMLGTFVKFWSPKEDREA